MKGLSLVLALAVLAPLKHDPRMLEEARRERFVTQAQAYIAAENKRKGGEFPRVSPDDLRTIVTEFDRAGMDPVIGLAVAAQESHFVRSAVSDSGAKGVFQFMPATAKDKKVDPLDVRSSARGAAKFLEELRDSPNSRASCRGEIRCALYHYFAGPNRRKGLRRPSRYAEEVLARARRIAER